MNFNWKIDYIRHFNNEYKHFRKNICCECEKIDIIYYWNSKMSLFENTGHFHKYIRLYYFHMAQNYVSLLWISL